MNNNKIDWNLFASEYVRIEENEPKDLVLSNWRQGQTEYEGVTRDALIFDVLEDDGVETRKKFETASKRLAIELKSLIERAEANEKNRFKCRITRVGSGKQTRYGVKELQLTSQKELPLTSQ